VSLATTELMGCVASHLLSLEGHDYIGGANLNLGGNCCQLSSSNWKQMQQQIIKGVLQISYPTPAIGLDYFLASRPNTIQHTSARCIIITTLASKFEIPYKKIQNVGSLNRVRYTNSRLDLVRPLSDIKARRQEQKLH